MSLSDKGRKAYNHHKEFHEEMVQAILEGMDEEQTEVLVKSLTKLATFFRSYGK